MKPIRLPIELRTHCDRLTAWHNGEFIGCADVRGSELVITANVAQTSCGAGPERELADGSVRTVLLADKLHVGPDMPADWFQQERTGLKAVEESIAAGARPAKRRFRLSGTGMADGGFSDSLR